MKKKASILFYSLMLLSIVSVLTLMMVPLFTLQIEILDMAREGNIAYYAAQSGVEHARNSIFKKDLSTLTCNGYVRNYRPMIEDKFTIYEVDDTSYKADYWIICSSHLIENCPHQTQEFVLQEYRITSTGTFGGATRIVDFSWTRPQ
jgi:competence protein ComGC